MAECVCCGEDFPDDQVGEYAQWVCDGMYDEKFVGACPACRAKIAHVDDHDKPSGLVHRAAFDQVVARADAAEARVKELGGLRASLEGQLAVALEDAARVRRGRPTRETLEKAEALADRLAGATHDGLGMLEIFLMAQYSCPTEAVVAMLDMGPKIEEKLRAALDDWRKAREEKL